MQSIRFIAQTGEDFCSHTSIVLLAVASCPFARGHADNACTNIVSGRVLVVHSYIRGRVVVQSRSFAHAHGRGVVHSCSCADDKTCALRIIASTDDSSSHTSVVLVVASCRIVVAHADDSCARIRFFSIIVHLMASVACVCARWDQIRFFSIVHSCGGGPRLGATVGRIVVIGQIISVTVTTNKRPRRVAVVHFCNFGCSLSSSWKSSSLSLISPMRHVKGG
jgi:hypothetical protein